jgi:hypothetical protein
VAISVLSPAEALRQHASASRATRTGAWRANPMSVVATAEERTAPSRVARRTTPAAALASLGICLWRLRVEPYVDRDWRANVERSQAPRKIFESGALW